MNLRKKCMLIAYRKDCLDSGEDREMMYYQSNSCLRPIDLDYGHKTFPKTEYKALKYAKNRDESVRAAELSANSGQCAHRAIHDDASPVMYRALITTQTIVAVNKRYKNRSCSRNYIKGYSSNMHELGMHCISGRLHES